MDLLKSSIKEPVAENIIIKSQAIESTNWRATALAKAKAAAASSIVKSL